MVKKIFHKKFLAWNAVAAGHIEVIEYLEELVDLVKLLVGADEFQSGMFIRSRYHEYMSQPQGEDDDGEHGQSVGQEQMTSPRDDDEEEQRDAMPEPEAMQKRTTTRKRTMSNSLALQKSGSHTGVLHRSDSRSSSVETTLPYSLQRVRSRRLEEMSLQKSKSGDDKGKSVER
jgi:hypothetical protein